jgi:hypothetical protein
MPAFFWKFLPHGMIVLAVLGGVLFIHHKGEQAAEQRMELAAAVQARLNAQVVRKIQAALTESVDAIDQNHAAAIANIETVNRTIIQPTLQREINRETRFSDPASGLSDGLRAAINSAIDLSCTATVDGGVICPLPTAQPAH